MNIEEVINNLKKYISFSEKECNFPSTFDWNWHMELANDIETLLTAYEKEKEKNKELTDKFNNKTFNSLNIKEEMTVMQLLKHLQRLLKQEEE